MFASKNSVRATLKIAAVYAFALSTAVACSKFEAATPLTSARGTATVTEVAPATTPPPAPSATTVSIDKVSTIYLGVAEDDETNQMWDLKMDVTHGGNKITFDAAPMFKPSIVIGASSTTIGTMDYAAQGVCGDQLCSKFAVMLTVRDTSNGTSVQKVQFWNLHLNNSAPQKELSNTAHTDVLAAYNSMSGETLGQ